MNDILSGKKLDMNFVLTQSIFQLDKAVPLHPSHVWYI